MPTRLSIIQKRIIQNLYDNPIVVCDVSGKNPNVMFELGLRLAFDKPTVIVKDDKTSYSFDTSPIEHITYPRDLRFTQVVEFKQKLAEKVKATRQAANDPSYTTFLKHFGEFKVAKLEKKEVSGQEFIVEELRSLRQELRRANNSRPTWRPPPGANKPENTEIMEFVIPDTMTHNRRMELIDRVSQLPVSDAHLQNNTLRIPFSRDFNARNRNSLSQMVSEIITELSGIQI